MKRGIRSGEYLEEIKMHYNKHATLTRHARNRMNQRGITRRQVEAILRVGRRRREAHSVLAQIHQEQVEQNITRNSYELLGIVVVLSPDERRVMTVYHGDEPTRSFDDMRYLGDSGPSFKLGDIIGPDLF